MTMKNTFKKSALRSATSEGGGEGRGEGREGGRGRHALPSTFGAFPTETNPVQWRKLGRSELSGSPRGQPFIKIKTFHRSFLLKSVLAVNNRQLRSSWRSSFCLPSKNPRPRAPGDPRSGARHLPRAGPATHPPRPGLQVAARTEIETLLESRRRDILPPSLPPSQAAVGPGRPQGSGPRPALTTAARGAPGRRQVQTSPARGGGGAGHGRRDSAALNNGGLGRAQRLRPGLQRLRLRRARGAQLGGLNPGSGDPGAAGRRRPRLPAAGAHRRGRALGARHQVIPQAAAAIGPRSGRHLHANGREGSPRFENRVRAGGGRLPAGPPGPDAHTASPFPTGSQSQRCLTLPPPLPKWGGIQKSKTPTLRSPRSLFGGSTVSN